MKRTIASRGRRIGLPAIVAIIIGIASVASASERPDDSRDPGRPFDGPYPAAPEADERGVGVVDSRGTLRGFVERDVSERRPEVVLPSGHRAKLVRDRGEVVGYLVAGHIGFVDVATAMDAELMTDLEACYVEYTSTLSASDECDRLLGSQGVDTTPDDTSDNDIVASD